MDIMESKKATRNGAIAAFIVVIYSTLLTMMAANSKNAQFAQIQTSAIWIDIILILLCGIGLLRQSRFAAVLLFIDFVLTKNPLQ